MQTAIISLRYGFIGLRTDGDTGAALTAEAMDVAPAELVILLEPGTGLAYESVIRSVSRIEESR